jgi:eukaryotic-like serine/threonine-protein kinase
MERQSTNIRLKCATCGQQVHLCTCGAASAKAIPDQSFQSSTSSTQPEPPHLAPTKTCSDIGSIIGDRYELISEIGSGGMGSVFKARHLALPKFFAIKILKSELSSDADFRARFEQEARTSSLLSHPHLVSIYNYGTTKYGEAFLVMDFIEGKSLADLLYSVKRIEQGQAVNLFAQICQGLSHAHGLGVIHRDLKPSNIMLVDTKDGADHVKIVDFGIAKMVTTDGGITQSLTKTGQFFGSPLYMSPEQGNGGKLDQRTDIYSLGILMYECLTSAPPFRGDNALVTIMMHSEKQPKPFDPSLGIVEELEDIVFKALEKDQENRYQSMEELRLALLNVSHSNEVDSGKSKPKASQSKSKKSPAQGQAPGIARDSGQPRISLSLVAVCLVALLIIFGGGYWFFQTNHGQPMLSHPAPPASISPTTVQTAAIDQGEPPHLPEIPASVVLPESAANMSTEELSSTGKALAESPRTDWQDMLPARYMTRALTLDPTFGGGYEKLADFYWIQHDRAPQNEKTACLEKCLVVTNEWIRHTPASHAVYCYRCEVYSALGRDQEALDDANTSLKIQDDHKMRLKHAYILHSMGRYQDAISEYEKYIEPVDVGDMFVEAQCYYDMHQYKMAIEYCTKRLKLSGPNSGLYQVRADSERDLHMYQEALADYERTNPDTQAQRTDWMRDCREHIAARVQPTSDPKIFEDAPMLDTHTPPHLPPIPDSITLPASARTMSQQQLVAAGEALANSKQTDWQDLRPARYFMAAAQADPTLSEAYRRLGAFYWRQFSQAPERQQRDLLEKCLIVYSEGLKRLPDDLDLLLSRTNVYGCLQMWPEALADADHELKIAPDSVDFHLQRAYALHELHRMKESVSEYEKYIRPTDTVCMYGLADCYRELKEYKKAIELCSKSLAQGGPRDLLLLVRADSERALGKYKEALQDYQACAKLKPALRSQREGDIRECQQALGR